jgi:hypothetical protein
MSKLTWLEGQDASWEGIEMTDEAHQKRFGCLGLVYGKGDEIIGYIDESDIYLKGVSEREAILKVMYNHLYDEISYSYDNALDERHGFAKEAQKLSMSCIEEFIKTVQTFILIPEIPESVKVTVLQEFEDEIEKYFENLRNNGI